MNKPYNEFYDEILERVWELKEEGEATILSLYDMCKDKDEVLNSLKDMEEENLIVLSDDNIDFTEQGKQKAALIIRRHRITDVLLYHVLNMKEHSEREKIACQTEHTLLPEMVNGICTLLGHPSISPDGKKIPPGDCCFQSENKNEIIRNLKDAMPAKKYRVTYIKPKNHDRFQRLMSLGLLPGTEFYLLQKFPAYVLKLGGSEIAFEEHVAEDIFVTDATNNAQNPDLLNNFGYGERRRGKRKHRNWFKRHFGTNGEDFEK